MPRRAFGRIRQLPSGRWQARIADPDGSLRSLGTYATRTVASRALSAHETDAARGAWTAQRASTQTLETYAAQWLETRALRPRTKEHYADQLRLRILPTLGPVPLSSLTPQRIRIWHADLRADAEQRRRGESALRTSYRVLRAILSTAVEDGLIGRNPCIIRKAGSEVAPTRPLLQEREVWALADAVPPRYEALVWLAAGTALRSAELSALRRCDVDLQRRELRVARAYVEPVRSPAYFGPPKSDAGVRTVALPQVIVPVLEEHLDRWAEAGPEGLLFTSEKGGPLSRHNRKWWRAAVLQAGLDPRTHLHDLRHAGLTLAAQSGATLRELMALAGHSSPRAALIYQHAAADRAAAVAAAMSERLSARPHSRRTKQAVLDVSQEAAAARSVPSEMGHAGGTTASERAQAKGPPTRSHRSVALSAGGAEGTRTPDPHTASQAWRPPE